MSALAGALVLLVAPLLLARAEGEALGLPAGEDRAAWERAWAEVAAARPVLAAGARIDLLPESGGLKLRVTDQAGQTRWAVVERPRNHAARLDLLYLALALAQPRGGLSWDDVGAAPTLAPTPAPTSAPTSAATDQEQPQAQAVADQPVPDEVRAPVADPVPSPSAASPQGEPIPPASQALGEVPTVAPAQPAPASTGSDPQPEPALATPTPGTAEEEPAQAAEPGNASSPEEAAASPAADGVASSSEPAPVEDADLQEIPDPDLTPSPVSRWRRAAWGQPEDSRAASVQPRQPAVKADPELGAASVRVEQPPSPPPAIWYQVGTGVTMRPDARGTVEGMMRFGVLWPQLRLGVGLRGLPATPLELPEGDRLFWGADATAGLWLSAFDWLDAGMEVGCSLRSYSVDGSQWQRGAVSQAAAELVALLPMGAFSLGPYLRGAVDLRATEVLVGTEAHHLKPWSVQFGLAGGRW